MTHEAVFTPQQGHFKWYKTDWQTEDAQLSGVADGDALRFRVCIVETGGAAGSNLDIDVEYSTDKSNWYTLGSQGATDKKFRWRDDVGLTDEGSIDQARLSCTTENGLIHESAVSNSEDVSASVHHEISVILEPYQPDSATTYYFRIILESTALGLNAEVSEYINCLIVTAHQQTVTDQAGLLDSVTKVQVAHKTVTDISGLSDSVSKVWVAHKTVSDSAGLSDSVELSLNTTETVSDIAGLKDSVSFVHATKKSVSDLAGLLDSVTIVHTPGGGAAYYQTVTDLAGLLDSVTIVHTPGIASTPMPVWLGPHIPEPEMPRYLLILVRDWLEQKLKN